jgi:HK97 gp10 family phage protein
MSQGIDPQKLNAYAARLARMKVEAAAIFLTGQIKENISVPSRTVTFKQGRGGKMRKVLGARGSNRSRAGEMPHKDFGNLRASITWEIHEHGDYIVALVGSPLRYSIDLEYGTKKMAARPFLRRTLKESQERIRQIVEHGETYDIH